VEEYVGGPDAAVERVIAAFQDVLACVSHSYGAPFLSLSCLFCAAMYCRKYRYMDSNLTQRRRGLEEKISEIKKTLSMVEFLRDRRVRLFFCPFFFCHSLNDGLFVFSRRAKERRQKRMETMPMTSRTISMAMRTESPRQSERRLNSPTHSTRRPSSKKRTQCSCGSGYYFLSYVFALRIP
jgi:hypothetical protein